MDCPTRLGFFGLPLRRQMQAAPAHLLELFDQFAGVLLCQLAGETSQTLETLLELLSGCIAVPILFRCPRKKLVPHPVQLSLHLPVTDEVQALELVDKPD